MKRFAPIACALVCALVLPFSAGAAQPKTAVGHGSTQARSQLVRHQVSGTIAAIDGYSFTIQRPGRRMPVIDALTSAADAVTQGDFPYVYGGGHEQAGIASIGIRGPGYNGRTVGFDCSGSVAAVLAGAGLWPVGTGVPADNGVIAQLLSENLIIPGGAGGSEEVNLYDDPGVHIFMNIDGRFFGTSDGGGGNAAQPKGGAGWLDDGAPDASSRAYRRYHVRIAVLRSYTAYGPSLTFQTHPSVIGGFTVGDQVRVSYTQASSGTMTAQDVAYVR